jgi:hypothetical protein
MYAASRSAIAARMHRRLLWARRLVALLLATAASGVYLAQSKRIDELTPGKSERPLCRILVERLNHSSKVCQKWALRTYPGFKDPPWPALDPTQHVELIARLMGGNGLELSASMAGGELVQRMRGARDISIKEDRRTDANRRQHIGYRGRPTGRADRCYLQFSSSQ